MWDMWRGVQLFFWLFSGHKIRKNIKHKLRGVNTFQCILLLFGCCFLFAWIFPSTFVCVFVQVWFKVKHHTRDPKQQLDKKKLVAFWLEHYAKRDHGKPLTVVFDMAETGISHIVSIVTVFSWLLLELFNLCYKKKGSHCAVIDT